MSYNYDSDCLHSSLLLNKPPKKSVQKTPASKLKHTSYHSTPGLEPLLKQFGVDLVIWAHEHSYERTWPLYDNKVYNGSLEQPYVNPG